MAYIKKDEYPSWRKQGIYPDGTDEELGLDSDNLEKFSLGNWNSISKSNRKYFVRFQDDPSFVEDLYENGQYLGRPVRVRFVDNGPVLSWTLVRREGGFVVDQDNDPPSDNPNAPFGTVIGDGYNSPIVEADYRESQDTNNLIETTIIPQQQRYLEQWTNREGTEMSTRWWQQYASIHLTDDQFGPLLPLTRFVDRYETAEIKRAVNFYRTFHHTYKRSDEDNHTTIPANVWNQAFGQNEHSPAIYSSGSREAIVEIFQEKYNDLKTLIDGATGYIREINPDDDDFDPDLGDFEIPIQLTFKQEVFDQIREILSFNVEVYADGRGPFRYYSGNAGNTMPDIDWYGYDFCGKSIADGYINSPLEGEWYHRFKLYFGAYNFNNDQTYPGLQYLDDKGRNVAAPTSGIGYDTKTYLPENSIAFPSGFENYPLKKESPIEYWGGIYLEKLTDDESMIKIGAHIFGNVSTAFTNIGNVGILQFTDSFYFGFTSDALLEWLEETFDIETREAEENRLLDIGHPFYTFDYIEDVNYGGIEQEGMIDELDYEVRCITENSDIDFLYYDIGDDYDETSYPVKMKFNMGLYGIEVDESLFGGLDTYTILDQMYTNQYNPLDAGSNSPNQGVYRYTVIQWGDEKTLLTDDQILNSEYFYLYTTEQVPTPDSYYYKRIVHNKSSQLNFTLDSFHVYNTPGVKIIKIIVYRYDSTGNVLLQTTLVTKNIVINDGSLLSQDFSIFGGTDFNFLPLKDNQAIIGGLDDDSKYNNSVEKIAKDDNFIQDDYLERASSKDFIDNFNKKLYGESPGQLDLSTTRMFKKPFDIYDFLNLKDGVMNQITESVFSSQLPIDGLSINSSATDIFIDDDDCIVELVPQELEYLTIPNEVGTNAKAVLIGDYKVNQPKDGIVQREGVMQTPMLEKNQDKQAF